MLLTNPDFAELLSFVDLHYGASDPRQIDKYIADMGSHLETLIMLFGAGVPILHVQALLSWPN
jgi:hypothetical protein